MSDGMLNALSSLLLVLIGYAASKGRLVSDELFDFLPSLLFSVCYPAIIIDTLSGVRIGDLLHDSAYVILFAWASTLVVYLIARFAMRNYLRADRKRIILFSLLVGNTSFVGLPVAQVLYGEAGIYFTVVYSMAIDTVMWSFLYFMVSGEERGPKMLKKLINPCFLALIAGVVLSACGITLPKPVSMPLQQLTGVVMPMALLLIGNMLSKCRVRELLAQRSAVALSAVKVTLIPAVAYAILALAGVGTQNAVLSAMMVGLPYPVIAVMFAKQFGHDDAYALSMVMLSTGMFLLEAALAAAVFFALRLF